MAQMRIDTTLTGFNVTEVNTAESARVKQVLKEIGARMDSGQLDVSTGEALLALGDGFDGFTPTYWFTRVWGYQMRFLGTFIATCISFAGLLLVIRALIRTGQAIGEFFGKLSRILPFARRVTSPSGWISRDEIVRDEASEITGEALQAAASMAMGPMFAPLSSIVDMIEGKSVGSSTGSPASNFATGALSVAAAPVSAGVAAVEGIMRLLGGKNDGELDDATIEEIARICRITPQEVVNILEQHS